MKLTLDNPTLGGAPGDMTAQAGRIFKIGVC